MAQMTEEQKERAESEARRLEEAYAECNRIDDPVRRGLCKACETPMAQGLPFCQKQEPPVP